MDGAEVGVFKKTDQISLTSFLESHDSGALEPQVGLEVLGNFTNKPLEWQLADEQFRGLLVPGGDQARPHVHQDTDLPPDLSQGDRARPVAVGFLDTPSGWSRLPGSLGGQLFPVNKIAFNVVPFGRSNI